MIAIHALEGNQFRLPDAAVAAGDLAAVVAPSAACAREFVDLLLGLATPRGGSVRLFGQALASTGEPARLALRSRLGFAAQAEGLVGHLALWENVLLGAGYHRRQDAAGLDARVRTLLGWCGWTEAEARRVLRLLPDQAAPFERAVAAWLRALLVEPALVVAENLLGGLAAEARRRLIGASAHFLAEDPRRAAVFVLVGEAQLEELQPTAVFYLSLQDDFQAEVSP
ncbi:MAG: hypothetical protein JSR48_01045 [Verrucomicrobia bacterium]|nr:hypothetical protein [Verrucomicrobiota bacterium]